MATRTKILDIVTKIVDGSDINTERSGEELTPALSSVSAAQAAGAYTDNPATVDGLIEVLVGNASTNIPVPLPFACKVVDAWAYKKGVSADAGDVLAIKNAAGDTLVGMSLNVADGARVTGLGANLNDLTKNAIAEDSALTVDPTSSTDCACTLFIRVKRTA